MLWPWNAARAASKRPLPKPRKVHGPVGNPALNVFTNTQLPPGDRRRYALVPDAQRRDELGEWMACQDCGCHECGCEQRFELQQEAQRAQLARSVDARHSMRPGVQQHLRHGDPRRMSLGYNERDYDESRRVNIAAMTAELEGMKARLLDGCSLDDIDRERIVRLGTAIAEHRHKMPLIDPSKPLVPSTYSYDGLDAWRMQKQAEEQQTARQEQLDKFRQKVAESMLHHLKPRAREAFKRIGSTDVTTDPDSFFVELEAEAGKQITTTVDQWNKLLGARSGELKWFRST